MSDQNPTIVFQPKPSHPKFIDLEGMTFNRLTVLGYAGRKGWYCLCKCGTVKTIRGGSLIIRPPFRSTQSCGCLYKEVRRTCAVKHGEISNRTPSPEYRAYYQALNRCQNPHYYLFAQYGGRGIEFRFVSFNEFLIDIGRRPTANHSLDRIDVDGHYEKGNVRWATREEQANNKRNNRRVTVEGVTRQVGDWMGTLGLARGTFDTRMARGWCEQCAVTLKPYGRCPHIIS